MLPRLFRGFSTVKLSPYTVLNLSPDASLDDAKKAYKRMVMKWHPDINKEDPRSNEKFHQITEAYNDLLKRISESRNELYETDDEGHKSVRPKYDGRVGSVLRDDKIREYINFTPLDIEIPHKDRLGL